MTIVVGVEAEQGTVLGADTLGVGGWDCVDRRDEKLVELRAATIARPGIGMGFTSSYRMGQVLGYGLRTWLATEVKAPAHLAEADHRARHRWVVTKLVPEARRLLSEAGYTKVENAREESGTWLLAIGNDLFGVEDDWQVCSADEGRMAVGCGFAYALGAMYTASRMHITEPPDLALRGLHAAINYSAGCGGRLTMLHVGERLL